MVKDRVDPHFNTADLPRLRPSRKALADFLDPNGLFVHGSERGNRQNPRYECVCGVTAN